MLSERDFAEFKRGSLQMIVLYLLREGDKYGYQIAQAIKRRGRGKFPVAESALYVALYRMLDKGYISKREETGVKKPKVFYHIEPAGVEFLDGLLDAYAVMNEGIANIMAGEKQPQPPGMMGIDSPAEKW